jgi:tRNA-specific 2-thiouridylase
LGEPIYVNRIDTTTNTLTIGSADTLQCEWLVAERMNYLTDVPSAPTRASAQIRYQHRAAGATLIPLGDSRARVEFDLPQRAVTPGQACVLYDGDSVLGGGWIAECGTRNSECGIS